jgi:hypothetical protein
MNITNNELIVLKKMRYNTWIGKKDKYEHTILSGFPKHVHKDLKKALKKLVKKGFVVSRPKPHGIKYGLNPRLIGEIDDIIEETRGHS